MAHTTGGRGTARESAHGTHSTTVWLSLQEAEALRKAAQEEEDEEEEEGGSAV